MKDTSGPRRHRLPRATKALTLAGMLGTLARPEATEWSWNAVFLDVDLDGWEDLLVLTGNERDSRNLDTAAQLGALRRQGNFSDLEILQQRRLFADYHTPNLAFRNRRDLTFEEVGTAWGFDRRGVSHGVALADLDNDGDLDVVINCLNAPAAIYRNDSPAPRLAVRLHGQAPNTRGIGARVEVERGAAPFQSQEIQCGGRYLSSDDAIRTFAAGTLANDLRITVKWRSGKRSVIEHARPNRIYEIDEVEAVVAPPTPPPQARPTFEDVSASLQHTHSEEPFNDWARQPLLPNRLSQLGPGVAWFDLDGDGWEDLLVATGKGGPLAAYRNDRQGGFKRLSDDPFAQPVRRDQTAVLGWQKDATHTVVLSGSANYEDGQAVGPVVRLIEVAVGKVDETMPAQASSTGPIALADIDGDGELDLFVGGRVVPGRYPEPASSMLLKGAGGRFVPDEANIKMLAQVGLVSGAVFSDLDGDGYPELILACEWGPIRIFHNERRRFSDATERLGLARYTGWWTGVATGDFDNDGRLDVVAANWGRNTKYQSHRGTSPLRLYFGDLAGDGSVQMIEAWFDPSVKQWVPERMLEPLARAIPYLRQRFPTLQAYGAASVQQILGDHQPAARVLEAGWLETTVFLNRGGHFEARPLPAEAQMAPAFAVCVADMDGDGNEDVFLSQNFFATIPETPRYDSGLGLWLKGDGRGGFRALSGQETGVKVYGEQRGAAVCDYDQDGRVDLVVAQNGAETKLYHNIGDRPGLRVRLRGAATNPGAVGAAIRLHYSSQGGPVRELRAGSGYWSQDSLTQVMGLSGEPTEVWVRWPGGKTTTTPVSSTMRAVTIGADGKLK